MQDLFSNFIKDYCPFAELGLSTKNNKQIEDYKLLQYDILHGEQYIKEYEKYYKIQKDADKIN